jgi:hypothetical protein
MRNKIEFVIIVFVIGMLLFCCFINYFQEKEKTKKLDMQNKQLEEINNNIKKTYEKTKTIDQFLDELEEVK